MRNNISLAGLESPDAIKWVIEEINLFMEDSSKMEMGDNKVISAYISGLSAAIAIAKANNLINEDGYNVIGRLAANLSYCLKVPVRMGADFPNA